MNSGEQGWFGYGFLGSHSTAKEIEDQFIENLRFAEFWCRRLGLAKKRVTLAARLSTLFDELPVECQRVITDNRHALIQEIVRTRNRFVHGDFFSPRVSDHRLHVLSIKLATLLLFSDVLHDYGTDMVLKLSLNGSPYLRGQLAQSDQPQSGV